MSEATWSQPIAKVEPNNVTVRGYRIDELMGRLPFAHVVYLVLKGELRVRDLWRQKDLGIHSGEFTAEGFDHGSDLVAYFVIVELECRIGLLEPPTLDAENIAAFDEFGTADAEILCGLGTGPEGADEDDIAHSANPLLGWPGPSAAASGRWCAWPAGRQAKCRRSDPAGRARYPWTSTSCCRRHRARGRGYRPRGTARRP